MQKASWVTYREMLELLCLASHFPPELAIDSKEVSYQIRDQSCSLQYAPNLRSLNLLVDVPKDCRLKLR